MEKNNDVKFDMLDGTVEEQNKATKAYLGTLTEEQKKRSMSSEFDYLDED